MNNYKKATGLIELEELKNDVDELNENGGLPVTVSPVISILTGEISRTLLPTTVCTSKCDAHIEG